MSFLYHDYMKPIRLSLDEDISNIIRRRRSLCISVMKSFKAGLITLEECTTTC